MKVFAVLSILFAAALAHDCYDDIRSTCSTRKGGSSDGTLLPHCNAKYGLFNKDSTILSSLQAYINAQIESSFEYLLMSSHFGNYKANRDGLKSLHRKLSDRAWEDAIDLIKYVTKRGGTTNFGTPPRTENVNNENILELNEVNSLAKALETQKRLAEEALKMHSSVEQHSKPDGAVAHYLEERFMEPQADTIRDLAGHITDLKQFLSSDDDTVAVFMFDEYLQKHL